MKDWIGLIGVFLGAAIAGGIAIYVSGRQLRHQRLLETEKRQLANFENVHEHLSKVATQAAILCTQIIGKLAMDAPLRSEPLGGAVPTDKLRMLIDFYAPSLAIEVEAMNEQWLVLGQVAAEAIFVENQPREWRRERVESARTASAEIMRLSTAAKHTLNELVRSLQHTV